MSGTDDPPVEAPLGLTPLLPVGVGVPVAGRPELAGEWAAAGRSSPPWARTKATDRANEAARMSSAAATAGVTVRFEGGRGAAGPGGPLVPPAGSSGTHSPSV